MECEAAELTQVRAGREKRGSVVRGKYEKRGPVCPNVMTYKPGRAGDARRWRRGDKPRLASEPGRARADLTWRGGG